VDEQKCTTVQDPVERKVPRENCVSVPRQECKQVPREKVEYRSEEVCTTVNSFLIESLKKTYLFEKFLLLTISHLFDYIEKKVFVKNLKLTLI